MAKNGHTYRVIFQPFGYPELVSEGFDFFAGNELHRFLARQRSDAAPRFVVETQELIDCERAFGTLLLPFRRDDGSKRWVRCWTRKRAPLVLSNAPQIAALPAVAIAEDAARPRPSLVGRLLAWLKTPKTHSHAA